VRGDEDPNPALALDSSFLDERLKLSEAPGIVLDPLARTAATPARLIGDPRRIYLDFLIRQSQRAKYVASVCEGAMLLAAAAM